MWLKRQQHNNTTTTWNQWMSLTTWNQGSLMQNYFSEYKFLLTILLPEKVASIQNWAGHETGAVAHIHFAYLHGNHIYKHQTKTKLLNVFIETTITIVDNQVFALTIQACPYIWILLHMDLSKKYSCISHQVELYFPQLISTKLTFFWGTLYKFTNTNTQIQIHKRKYTNTNTQIQLHK